MDASRGHEVVVLTSKGKERGARVQTGGFPMEEITLGTRASIGSVEDGGRLTSLG